MTFGEVPLAEAEGAILAHSQPLSKGRLRKGRVLDADDIATLRAEGIASVVVARLGPGDVQEDDAARALARALVPDEAAAHLRRDAVGTGRVNLIAEAPGVVEVDAAAVDALNAVDPTITLATVPRWQQMDAGGMVGTVKIISYGVARPALDAACDAGAAALRLHPPTVTRAAFIQTTVGDDDGQRGHEAIAARLDRLGVAMAAKRVVAHETGALAAALAETTEEVVLILTASATSDIADVAPAAVEAAGGQVIHFGMPVDPGNLLFLGRLGARTVIGLPGCARSPALNGADWVISRVLCGIEVSARDIAGMGVGGLLKEIPTRPQPRRARAARRSASDADG